MIHLRTRAFCVGAALVLGISFVPASAEVAAAPILLASNGYSSQVNAYEPVGQSFIADDRHVFAGLFFTPGNVTWPNTDPIEYQLLEGDGLNGAVLATAQFLLPSGFTGFHLVDFTPITLTPGTSYTLTASVVGTSPYWAVAHHSNHDFSAGGTPVPSGNYGDIYTGGQAFGYSAFPIIAWDLALSVRPPTTTSDVPEPASLLLFGVALTGTAWATRRRR